LEIKICRKIVMTREEICTYEVCKLAKEKGFQLDCIGYYDFAGEFYFNYESAISNKERTFCHNKYNNIWHRDLTDAPTQSLLQRWLREEKKLHIDIVATASGYCWVIDETNGTSITDSDVLNRFTNENSGRFDTYELALEDALKYALENLV